MAIVVVIWFIHNKLSHGGECYGGRWGYSSIGVGKEWPLLMACHFQNYFFLLFFRFHLFYVVWREELSLCCLLTPHDGRYHFALSRIQSCVVHQHGSPTLSLCYGAFCFASHRQSSYNLFETHAPDAGLIAEPVDLQPRVLSLHYGCYPPLALYIQHHH